MDTPPTPSRLHCRIEHCRPDGAVAVLATADGLRAAAWVFEDAVAGFLDAGLRGTLALVCEVGGQDIPVATRRVAPGTAG